MPKGSDIWKAHERALGSRWKFVDPTLAGFLSGGEYAPDSETITKMAAQPEIPSPQRAITQSPMLSSFLAQLSSQQGMAQRARMDRLGALGIGGGQIEQAVGGPLMGAQNALLGMQGQLAQNLLGQQYAGQVQGALQGASELNQMRRLALAQTYGATGQQLQAQLGPLLSGYYGAAGNRGGFGGFMQNWGPTIGQLAGAAVSMV